MHDILIPKWMCSESHNLFEFWEISDDTSKMMKERHSCNGRLIGNRMWYVEWHHCQFASALR